MKKPNITEGEWKKDNLNNLKANGQLIICCSKSDQEANAKAISAVPEMIDALIEAYGAFYEDHRFDSSGKGRAVGIMKQALEKAGVEL